MVGFFLVCREEKHGKKKVNWKDLCLVHIYSVITSQDCIRIKTFFYLITGN